jgi:glutaminyl-tRNA synthetase
MVVLEPLKVNIINFPGSGTIKLNVPDFPDFPDKSFHTIAFTKTVYIEQSDFKFEADKNFRRLTREQSVGLRHAGYVISFVKIVAKDSSGQVTEIDVECSLVDKVEKKPKAFIHWVSNPIKIEVRLYERLFKHKNPEDVNEVPNGFLSDINEHSLNVLEEAVADSHISKAKVYDKFQFERSGECLL